MQNATIRVHLFWNIGSVMSIVQFRAMMTDKQPNDLIQNGDNGCCLTRIFALMGTKSCIIYPEGCTQFPPAMLHV